MPTKNPSDFADAPSADWADRLRDLLPTLDGRIVFTTSFGLEDQAITHVLAEFRERVSIVTLDTGRLFQETLELWAETEQRYGLTIAGIAPEAAAVEALLIDQGAMGFRRSIEARQACCHVRKVTGLNRALAGVDHWITGLRADQSGARGDTVLQSRDEARGLMKINPLFDQTREAIVAFCEREGVPVNALHAQGFLSIGCAPCTRALQPGESERAGRWWWEQDEKKECGLHPGRRPAATVEGARA